MKSIILPFSCIKAHYEGDIFTPVNVAAGVWELQSATRVLGGSSGNIYQFKSAENAAMWVDSNLIRASKTKTTRIEMINTLVLKNNANPQPYLSEEIAVLNARNAGEWGIILGGSLTDDWDVYPIGNTGAKGDKGDKGDAGANGLNGIDGAKGDKGDKGDTGAAGGGVVLLKSPVLEMPFQSMAFLGIAHNLGGEPDYVRSCFEILTAIGGYVVGEKIWNVPHGFMTMSFTDTHIYAQLRSNGASLSVSTKNNTGAVNLPATHYKLLMQGYRWKST